MIRVCGACGQPSANVTVDVLGFVLCATCAPLPQRVECAWCAAEGKRAVLRPGRLPVSHSICAAHEAAWLARAGLSPHGVAA